jgi:hypothetical protein
MKKYSTILMGLLVVVLLQACTDKRPAEEIVRERAQERLDLLMAKDVEAAYQYTTPGYRATTSAQVFALRVGGVPSWTEAKVDTVTCEEEICQVKTLISYEIKRLKMQNTRPMDEKWLKSDGEWYLYYK